MRDACGRHSTARCDARERPAARSSGVEGNASSHKVCCTPPIIWPDATPIPARESLTVEFKSDRARLSDRDLVEAIVCLANGDGGEL
jgi:hypothetical protein